MPVVISRPAARKAGLRRYFTGKPCKRGHVSERLVSDKHCLGCHYGSTPEERKQWNKHRKLMRTVSPEKRTRENKRRRRMAKATPEKRLAFNRKNYKRLIATPEGQIISRLRARLYYVLHSHTKIGRTIDIVGCTVEEIKSRFESLMIGTAMTFNDPASWSIDHIRPIASFDHSDPAQVLQCWNWSNLQPLPLEENRRKGSQWLTGQGDPPISEQ